MQELIIATRASDLALWQANYVKDVLHTFYPKLSIKLNKIVSGGDKILDKPLALIGGKGHFTKELEESLLCGESHMAVHSLKDVPTYIHKDLELCAITKRCDQRDVLLSYKYKSLDDLPNNAVVGTTSLRRKMQILSKRPDLIMKNLRGNINTRLKKLKNGEYDAIVLAYVGVHRLGLSDHVPFSHKFSINDMIPPMGQASLGIEIISNNSELKNIAMKLNDINTFLCVKIERDFIRNLQVGCTSPVACNAIISANNIKMEAMVGYPNGTKIIHEKIIKPIHESSNLGLELANVFIELGALDILEYSEKNAFKFEMPERL